MFAIQTWSVYMPDRHRHRIYRVFFVIYWITLAQASALVEIVCILKTKLSWAEFVHRVRGLKKYFHVSYASGLIYWNLQLGNQEKVCRRTGVLCSVTFEQWITSLPRNLHFFFFFPLCGAKCLHFSGQIININCL